MSASGLQRVMGWCEEKRRYLPLTFSSLIVKLTRVPLVNGEDTSGCLRLWADVFLPLPSPLPPPQPSIVFNSGTPRPQPAPLPPPTRSGPAPLLVPSICHITSKVKVEVISHTAALSPIDGQYLHDLEGFGSGCA